MAEILSIFSKLYTGFGRAKITELGFFIFFLSSVMTMTAYIGMHLYVANFALWSTISALSFLVIAIALFILSFGQLCLIKYLPSGLSTKLSTAALVIGIFATIFMILRSLFVFTTNIPSTYLLERSSLYLLTSYGSILLIALFLIVLGMVMFIARYRVEIQELMLTGSLMCIISGMLLGSEIIAASSISMFALIPMTLLCTVIFSKLVIYE